MPGKLIHAKAGDGVGSVAGPTGTGDNGPMLIVTPNPAVDHTVRLAELRPGEVLRAGDGASAAGGKGGNVARAAGCLGARATILAPVPEVGGENLRALYRAEGFALVAVPVPGRVRTCTVLLEDAGRVTLINEAGARFDAADWDRLMGALAELLDGSDAPGPIVCSGSMPPGAPVEGYAQIVQAGHRAGREVLVDAAGPALRAAIAAGADLVCPNLSEAEAVIDSAGTDKPATGERVHDDGDDVPGRAAAAANALRGLGARWAVVTAGAAGAAICGPDVADWASVPEVTVRNPIGAGDSFLAGLVTARESGRDWPTAIRRGLATGSASVEQAGAGVVDPTRVDEMEAAVAAQRQ